MYVILSYRSNPGTPTQPRRPDYIGVSGSGSGPVASAAQPSSSSSYYQHHHHHHHHPYQGSHECAEASPQRRFLSEGELLRDSGTNADIPPPYPRPNNTVDNIRELASSPQRGVYMWKEASPNPYYQQRSIQGDDCTNTVCKVDNEQWLVT